MSPLHRVSGYYRGRGPAPGPVPDSLGLRGLGDWGDGRLGLGEVLLYPRALWFPSNSAGVSPGQQHHAGSLPASTAGPREEELRGRFPRGERHLATPCLTLPSLLWSPALTPAYLPLIPPWSSAHCPQPVPRRQGLGLGVLQGQALTFICCCSADPGILAPARWAASHP